MLTIGVGAEESSGAGDFFAIWETTNDTPIGLSQDLLATQTSRRAATTERAFLALRRVGAIVGAMDALASMDVLAEASLAETRMAESEEAAQILNLLREHREPDAADDPGRESEGDDNPQPWSRAEDDLLRRLALPDSPDAGKRDGRPAPPQLDMHAWHEISQHFDNRSALQCAHRLQKMLNPENIKGPWCANEDAQLVELVKQYGGKHWARIASMLPGRTGKQCRERWCNNLDPSLKKGAWTAEVRRVHTNWSRVSPFVRSGEWHLARP